MNPASSIQYPASSIEHQASSNRAAALTADTLGHRWRDTALQPWNHNREAIFLALHKADIPAPDFDELALIESFLEERKQHHLSVANREQRTENGEQRTANSEQRTANITLADLAASGGFTYAPYYPAAAKTLWLAAHEPKDWQHLRGHDLALWLAEIETWAAENIGPDELDAAVQLAYTLRTAHRPFITLPRPHGSTSYSKHAGN